MVSSALADARSTSCRAAEAMLAMLMEESTRLISSAPADSPSVQSSTIQSATPDDTGTITSSNKQAAEATDTVCLQGCTCQGLLYAYRQGACEGCRRASCGVTLAHCRRCRRQRPAAQLLHQGRLPCCPADYLPLQDQSCWAVPVARAAAAAAGAKLPDVLGVVYGQASAGLLNLALLMLLLRDCPRDGCSNYHGALQKACQW
jgi:hypothetical protein